MNTLLTGTPIAAGNLTVNGEPHTGIFIETPPESLTGKQLPLYKTCLVIEAGNQNPHRELEKKFFQIWRESDDFQKAINSFQWRDGEEAKYSVKWRDIDSSVPPKFYPHLEYRIKP